MSFEIDIPSFGIESFQVLSCGFGPRQYDEIGISWQWCARLNHYDLHARFGRQWVEIVEVCDPVQARHGNADRIADFWFVRCAQRH